MVADRLLDEEGVPTISRFIAYKIGKTLDRKGRSYRVRTWFQSLLRAVLHLSGFACLTIAGFSVTLPANIPTGFVVAGLSCFAMSWLLASGQDPEDDETHRPATFRR